MKKSLLLGVAITLVAPLSMSAYTASEIASTGKCWVAINCSDESTSDFGGRMGNIPYMVEGDYDISVNSDGTLYIGNAIRGVYNGEDDNFVDYSSIKLTIDGTTATCALNKYIQPVYAGKSGFRSLYKQVAFYNLGYYNNSYYYVIMPAKSVSGRPAEGVNDWTGTVTKNSDGTYTITMDDFYVTRATYKSGGYGTLYDNDENRIGSLINDNYYDISKEKSLGGLTIRTYLPTHTATDAFYNNATSVTTNRTYSVNVKMDNGALTIENWGNLGQANQCTFVPSGSDQWWSAAYNVFDGSYDLSTLSVQMNKRKILLTPYPDYYYMYETMILSDPQIINGEPYGINIDGTIRGTVSHKGGNLWLDGVNYTTEIDNMSFYFPEYHIGDCAINEDYPSQSYIEQAKITETLIPVADSYEYTHSVDFDESSLSLVYSEAAQTYYINGQIDQNSIKNPDFVDSYELCIMPGKHTQSEVTGADFIGYENGHRLGLNIEDQKYWNSYKPQAVKGRALSSSGHEADDIEANSNGKFSRYITAKELKDAGLYNGDHLYTIYLKAIYNHADLNPTFHALTALDGTTTGIEDITEDAAAQGQITVNGTAVTLLNTANRGLIATTAGAVVYQGGDATVTLAPGIYIVRAGDTTQRIIVK